MTRLERFVLRERIRDRLAERILRGEYPAGARLVETRIARELGVSQASVREAVRDLEAMRLVESVPYRGAKVRGITEDELSEIYPVRAALEELAGRAAATRITPREVTNLDTEFERMSIAARAGDRRAQVQHDFRFHEGIVSAAGNHTLLEVWRSLHVETRTLVTSMSTQVDLQLITEKHRSVLEAFRARDPERAAKELRDHIEYFGSMILGR